MKRIITFMILITILATSIPITASAQTTKAIRVVIDGEVHSVKANVYQGEWYLKPADIKSSYTKEDVANVYSQLIKTIRDKDPDRFIL